MKRVNSNLVLSTKQIGTFFALSLVIPTEFLFNFFGLNLKDLPLLVLFVILIIKFRFSNVFNTYSKYYLLTVFLFVVYFSFFSSDIDLLNKANLRMYFYWILSYFIVSYIYQNNLKIIEILDPLKYVMIINFLIIIFQIQLGGFIDGWIFNNREATFYFSTGKLGGIQGGGPNVIGIISAISAIYFFYFTLQNYISSGSIFSHKEYPFYFLISSINLFFTFSRGSYLAFIYGFLILITFERFFKLKVKIFVYFGILIFGTISLFLFSSTLLRSSNRVYLSEMAISNLNFFNGTGGGNYIREVYKPFLITLDQKEVLDKFNITYLDEELKTTKVNTDDNINSEAYGFLKLKFDYKTGIFSRSKISFYHSNDGITWQPIGQEHSNGTVINLIDNDSFFELGGWGDGQSLDGSKLSGLIKKVVFVIEDEVKTVEFSEQNENTQFYLFSPKNRYLYDGIKVYTENGIKLERPRDYWVAIPNFQTISQKDFEIIIEITLDSIPKGNETLFSQSSILKVNENFNDQSWKWSLVEGRMYFFWIESVDNGYSQYLGGQSLSSSKLISNNGQFSTEDFIFSLNQYDEITTSHNGFLTLMVEYGIFPVALLLLIITTILTFSKNQKLEKILFTMILLQNLTNDLIYSPDVAMYFWLFIAIFSYETLRVKNRTI